PAVIRLLAASRRFAALARWARGASRIAGSVERGTAIAMGRGSDVLSWSTVGAIALVTSCTPPSPVVDPLRPPTTGEGFQGVQCSAVRPQTEPDLMGWDSGSRANLKRLREDGVVAVRYEAKGCN